MSRIYLASSWRNAHQPRVVEVLRAAGHEVYDFRHPQPGESGFAWSKIDEHSRAWTPSEYIEALDHPAAETGYRLDYAAMIWADTFVLVLPCGRSAHLELGWAVGRADRRTAVLFEDTLDEPELMYKMVDCLAPSEADLLAWLEER